MRLGAGLHIIFRIYVLVHQRELLCLITSVYEIRHEFLLLVLRASFFVFGRKCDAPDLEQFIVSLLSC